MKRRIFSILLALMLVLGFSLMMAVPAAAVPLDTGSITVNIKDLQGNDIEVGPQVRGDLWGVSQPTVGGDYTWHHMNKDAALVGDVSSVTWTAAEIDAEVNLSSNHFWFAINAWGGNPWANTQVFAYDGLYSTYMLYDPAVADISWDVHTLTDNLPPATVTSSGIYYNLDLSGVTWDWPYASVDITYQGCDHDLQPTISADTKAYMESEGYAFSFNAADGLLTITNAGTGFDQTYSAREDGAGGYTQEMEIEDWATVSYDAGNEQLVADFDYVALGLNDGDTFFCNPGFYVPFDEGPPAVYESSYSTYNNTVYAYASLKGYVGHTLDPLEVVAPVRNVNTGAGYFTIQEAIDAASAGDTINVAVGTYDENVTIDKGLTLNGVQHGVTAVGRSGDESTIDGGTTNAVSISASNVILDGFTITIANKDATDKQCGVCIANDNSGLSDVTVKNNIIKDISDGDTDTTSNCTYGILTWGTTNGPSSINIQNNAIQNVEEYAIAINDLSSNVTIDGNSITNMLAAQRTDGRMGVAIGIGGSATGPSNVDITDNTLNTGLTGDGSTTDAGVGIGMDFAPTGVTMTGNDITGNSEGIAVKSTTSPTVHFNNIYGNSIYGVHNYETGSLDATNNWWGDTSGPADGTGSNEVPPCATDPTTEINADGAGDTVSDNVDYCPWLGEEYAPTKSTNTTTGTGTASFSPDSGALEDLTSVAEGTLPSAGKPDLVFPHGFFCFNITGITPGATVIVTITLPSPVPLGTQYWKYHASEGGWIQIPMGSNDGDNVITITLVDGGLGDDDGTADGVIVDQGGPGSAPPPPRPGVGGELYPVNKPAILAPWIGLAVAVIAGAYIFRKRRTSQR